MSDTPNIDRLNQTVESVEGKIGCANCATVLCLRCRCAKSLLLIAHDLERAYDGPVMRLRVIKLRALVSEILEANIVRRDK